MAAADRVGALAAVGQAQRDACEAVGEESAAVALGHPSVMSLRLAALGSPRLVAGAVPADGALEVVSDGVQAIYARVASVSAGASKVRGNEPRGAGACPACQGSGRCVRCDGSGLCSECGPCESMPDRAAGVCAVCSGESGLPGGPRGAIREFSRASRHRLRESVSRLAPDLVLAEDGAFVSLSYGRDAPSSAVAKRHLGMFLDRFRRRYPVAGGLWVREFQRRGADHFHLIVAGLAVGSKFVEREDAEFGRDRWSIDGPHFGDRGEFGEWASSNWLDISGLGGSRRAARELRACDVRPLIGCDRLAQYLAGEFLGKAKEYQRRVPEGEEWVGRFWALIGKRRCAMMMRPFGVVELGRDELMFRLWNAHRVMYPCEAYSGEWRIAKVSSGAHAVYVESGRAADLIVLRDLLALESRVCWWCGLPSMVRAGPGPSWDDRCGDCGNVRASGPQRLANAVWSEPLQKGGGVESGAEGGAGASASGLERVGAGADRCG